MKVAVRVVGLFLLVSLCFSDLILIDGSDVRVSSMKREYPDSIIGKPISKRSRIKSNESFAFFSICDGVILHLNRFTTVDYIPGLNLLRVRSGQATLFTRETPVCFGIEIDRGVFRYGSPDTIDIFFNDSLITLRQGDIVRESAIETPERAWYRRLLSDTEYLFDNLDAGNIPNPQYKLNYPSRARKTFSYGSSVTSGVTTYEGMRYYYSSLTLRARLWEMNMAFNFLFAFDRNARFYKEAWDDWGDLFSIIEYIQLYDQNSPIYLRIGLLENLNYGSGLLMSNYNNAVFLPFDRLSGLEMRYRTKSVKGGFFANDISKPRVFGFESKVEFSDRWSLKTAYIADFDLFARIADRDGDSYPDRIDPEPDTYNDSTDSIIVANNVQSFNDFNHSQLHTIDFEMSYELYRSRDISTNLSGAIAMHSQLGSGMSLPQMDFTYGWVSLGLGLDFQTPNFDGWIFDRNYESEKARFVYDPDSNLVLITIIEELEDEKNWQYGWNNSFSLRIPRYVYFSTNYRDIYRGRRQDRKFAMEMRNRYPFSDIMISSSIFIDNRNFDHLFHLKNDGSSWGAEVRFRVHHAIGLRLRYRERYRDINRDGKISSNEIERNFDGSASVDFEYWFKRYIDWRRARKHRSANPS